MNETDRPSTPRGELLKQISNAMVGIKKNQIFVQDGEP